MCGFAGMVRPRGIPVDQVALENMSAAIHHRGPDAAGIYISGPVGLASRRLSILDLSIFGHQPMSSPDGQVILVFNGEIYNYVELRKELEALGHIFRSTGDTEVLLHAYLAWGRECLYRLNGMWAFLIYDLRQRKVFGSRDRVGKKPLYYYRSDEGVLFGSEIKAILASGYYTPRKNWAKISELLLADGLESQVEDKHTFYLEIDQVPAGHAFELDLEGRFNEWCFWSPLSLRGLDPEPSIRELPLAFYETFKSACSFRMRSDVPVGVLLSGGIDSTSILCCLADLRNGDFDLDPISAFSYQAKEYDESLYINDSVRQTGVRLIQYSPEPRRLWDSLEKMLWYQDEPVHSMGAVLSFEMYRLASQRGVRVILHGGGADEYLAGYPSFFQHYWSALLKSGKAREAWREIGAYCVARGGRQWPLFQNSLRYLCKSELRRFRAYQELARWNRRRELRKHPWFTAELFAHLPSNLQGYLEPSLDGAIERAITSAPLPVYLRIDDRNSMAHSIEARAPFLDYRLVALTHQQSAHWKIRGPLTKYLLREAMRQRIPESVRTRVDKWGFPVPAKQWFAGELIEQVEDLLESQEVRERGIYNLDKIRKDYALHKKGLTDISAKLFDVVQFELWCNLRTTQRPKHLM
jgi:asparagine synthase (glutamine-hydrolysing)